MLCFCSGEQTKSPKIKVKAILPQAIYRNRMYDRNFGLHGTTIFEVLLLSPKVNWIKYLQINRYIYEAKIEITIIIEGYYTWSMI